MSKRFKLDFSQLLQHFFKHPLTSSTKSCDTNHCSTHRRVVSTGGAKGAMAPPFLARHFFYKI